MYKKLAKLKYLPNNFQIIEEGDYVIYDYCFQRLCDQIH